MTLKTPSILLVLAATLALAAAQAVAAPDILPLPRDLCIPDGTGEMLELPTLEAVGAPLVVSNSPEAIRGRPGAVALCRTTVTAGHFRVFLHHVDETAAQLHIGVAITNPASARSSVEVYLGANSQLRPRQCRSTVDPNPATAGWRAMRNWLLSSARASGDQWLCTLRPGQTRYVVQTVPSGATVAGMYDFGAKCKGSSAGPPALRVSVIACCKLPSSVGALQLAKPDVGRSSWHRRGLFAHGERRGQVEAEITGIRWLDLAGPPESHYCNIMPNEMEGADDDPHGQNPGNYGVVYNLKVIVHNPLSRALSVRCLVSAAGGTSFSGLTLERSYVEAVRLLKAYESWTYHTVRLAPGERKSYNIRFTLPGGCPGAHRLLFWPEIAG